MTANLNNVKFFTGLFFLAGTIGCFQHYYKVTPYTASTQSEKASVVDSLNNQNRYFILRNGSNAYYMQNIAMSSDKKSINCTVEDVPPEHELYVTTGRNADHGSYKPGDPGMAGVINEIHLYIAPDTSISKGHYALPLDSLKKIEIIQKDKKRTKGSYVLGGVGVAAAAAAIFALVLGAAFASSFNF